MTKTAIGFFSLTMMTALLLSCSSSDSSNATQDRQANAGYQQSRSTPPTNQATAIPKPVTDQPAVTGMAALTAYDIYGNRRNLSEWIGKQPVVINFWGTWCPPCRREIPDLIKLYEEYHPRGVEIVGIAVRDHPTKVSNFVKKSGMNWVMLMIEEEHIAGFKLGGSIPTTIFLDKDGNEVTRLIGMQGYKAFKGAFEMIAASG